MERPRHTVLIKTRLLLVSCDPMIRVNPLDVIKYARSNYKMPPLNAHADIFSRVRGLNYVLNTHLVPYYVYVRSKGSGETAHVGRLAPAFPAHLCDEYQNLTCWLEYILQYLGFDYFV